MPLIRILPILPILAACTLICLSTLESAATVIHVPGDQPTVQIAVDVAASGDTVLVAAGTYPEGVVVLPKTLYLIGSGSSVTSIASLYYVEATGAETSGGSLEAMGVLGAIEGGLAGPFEMADCVCGGTATIRTGDNGQVGDLAVTGSSFAGPTDWDALAPFSHVSIRSCDVVGGGIDANGGYVSVADCIVDGGSIRTYGEDCEVQRCHVTGGGVAVSVGQFSAIAIDNVVSGAPVGIDIGALEPVTVLGNKISACDVGVFTSSFLGAQVLENHIRDCGTALLSLATVFANDNLIWDCVDGIVCRECGSEIERNTIVDCTGDGVRFECPGVSRIVGNLVSQCGTGVRGPAGGGTIECNDVWGSAVIDWADLTDPTGTGGNFRADPLFCGGDGAGGFQVDAVSPCLPGNHPDGADCGTVGALGQGCDSSAEAPGPGETTTHGSALVATPNPSASWIRVRGPSSSGSNLRIFDSGGRLLRELRRSSPDAAWEWDGRDATGAAVPSGAYYLRVDGALPSRILRIR